MTLRAVMRMVGFAVLAAMALAEPAAAQSMGGPPNALQGFSINREKPIRITSTTLEVRDKEKRATFIGNVVVAQGDTTMKSKTLDVFYDQENDGSEDVKPAQAVPTDQGQIRRLEAKGGVVVTQKDQVATGESGVFDMKSNTVTLIGNVVITQGPQVVKGERLTVNLTSGESVVDGGKSGVQALFFPNQARAKPGEKVPDSKAAESAEKEARAESRNSKDAAKPAGKPASNHPLKLN